MRVLLIACGLVSLSLPNVVVASQCMDCFMDCMYTNPTLGTTSDSCLAKCGCPKDGPV